MADIQYIDAEIAKEQTDAVNAINRKIIDMVFSAINDTIGKGAYYVEVELPATLEANEDNITRSAQYFIDMGYAVKVQITKPNQKVAIGKLTLYWSTPAVPSIPTSSIYSLIVEDQSLDPYAKPVTYTGDIDGLVYLIP